MLKIIFLLTFLTGGMVSMAQKQHTISGTVKDQKTGEVLIGASIILLEQKGFGTISNGYGFFSLTAPQGNYTLVISFSGYTNDTLEISLKKDIIKNINLQPGGAMLQAITISGRSKNSILRTLPGVQSLSVEEIKNVPVIFGEKDILKTIQLLPGVKSGGDGQAGFYVRGGNADQNLILLDGATVYNASHLLGFFSTFNSDAIKDVTLYKGDMPAEYGGRLSSLLDIKMNDGNNKENKVSGGVGLIASHLNVEGPIVKDKGSFMISARRTYADLFVKLSKDTNLNRSILYFYDINAKANYQLGPKDKLFLSAYLGKDNLGFLGLFGIQWGNTTTTLRYNHIFSSKLFSNTSLIYSNYNYNISVTQSDNSVTDVSKIKDFSLKEDLQYYVGNGHKVNFGFDATQHIFAPGVFNSSQNSSFNSLTIQNKYSLDLAAYLSDEWNVSDKIKFNYGLRLSSFILTGPGSFYRYDANGNTIDTTTYSSGKLVKSYTSLQPRFASTYQLNRVSSLKFSYSRNVQYLHLLSNSTGSNPTDLWIPSSNNVKPELSDQVSAGYYRSSNNNQYEFSGEIYYKYLQNQIDYKNGAELIANQNVESQLVYGIGRAYGLELYAKKKLGKLTGWISYTLSRTERKFAAINNDSWFPARQDETHSLSVVGIYKPNTKWTFSADFVYNTGNAVTWPSGKYNVNGNTVFYYTERNGYRLPSYNRMDVSAILQGKKRGKYDHSWVFSIYNLYARENPYFVQFQDDPDNPQRTQAVQYSLFRLIPSVTYNFKF
ncbi:MAG: TonB-dependent receptor [Bacteroidota bacterium]|nr:TonB-dependent receptor [Bacteroidota bacterium]